MVSVPQVEMTLKSLPSFRAPFGIGCGLSCTCFTKFHFLQALTGVIPKCATQLYSCIQISISEPISQGT